MHGFQLHRVAIAKGCTVTWQNAVGPYLGQSGKYKFKTVKEASQFAAYAGGSDPPSLAKSDLHTAGMPIPTNRIDHSG